jgi:hypothetical protein
LNDLNPATLAKSEFSQPSNPRLLTGNFVDLGPLTGLEHVERQQHLGSQTQYALIEILSQIVSLFRRHLSMGLKGNPKETGDRK